MALSTCYHKQKYYTANVPDECTEPSPQDLKPTNMHHRLTKHSKYKKIDIYAYR